MRWKQTLFVEGDTRVNGGFLFFPKTIGLETRWLERATWLEEVKKGIFPPIGYWYAVEWLDDEAA